MGLSAPTARLNPSPAPTAWVSSPTKSRALKGQIKPCHHYRQNLPDHALRRLLGGFPPLLPRLAKRGACTPVSPERNLNSFGSRFQSPPHSRPWHRAIAAWGNACDEKPLRPTSRLRPHPRRPRPRKTPANSQPAWQRNPAPAVRHHCRTPNQIESFSPVGPASSRKRAIRYRSSTGLAFAFGSACHHQPLVPPAEQMPKLPMPAVKPRRVIHQTPSPPNSSPCLARPLPFPAPGCSTPNFPLPAPAFLRLL